jgi:hypothetical protein
MDRDKAVFQIATRKPSRTALIGAAVVLLPVAVAQAQTPGDTPEPLLQGPPSVESYSLPPGPNNNPAQERLQGPVDPEIPLAKPTVVPPSTSPAPSQRTPQPDSQSTAPAPVKSNGGRALTQPDHQPDPIPQSPEVPSENAMESPTSQPAPAANEPQQPAAEPDDADPSPAASPPAPDGESTIGGWLLWLAAALLSVLLGTILLWRKRHARPEQPIAPPLVPEPDAGAMLVPETVTRISEPLSPVPALSIAFQPRSANATLINAVLNFELTLSNPGSDDLSDIRITGTMAQARDHGDRASIPLSPLAEVAQLRNGESEKVIGEFRIPLNSIDPILFQSQALFVPMVKISIEFADAAGHRHVQTASFLVGREHQPPRPKMAPFRLDLGPRSFAPLGYRALASG